MLQGTLLEWESIATRLIEQLHTEMASDKAANWRPHYSQILRALLRYRETCRDELNQIGLWREDGLQPAEVHEALWTHGDQLAHWLERMVVP